MPNYDNTDTVPGGFVRFEDVSSADNTGKGWRLAVDSYGRRWEAMPVPGNPDATRWHPAPRGLMSPAVWAQHTAGCEKHTKETATMTLSTTAPNSAPSSVPAASEVTGIRSVIAQMEAVAAAHEQIAGNEGFLGSLQRMEVGADDQQRFLAAQEASRNAMAAWQTAVESVRRHNDPVGEAYRQSPGAANKQANTNE
jgi:hypothetical protein